MSIKDRPEYRHGWNAYMAWSTTKKISEACPYPDHDSDEYALWIQGWFDAKRREEGLKEDADWRK